MALISGAPVSDRGPRRQLHVDFMAESFSRFLAVLEYFLSPFGLHEIWAVFGRLDPQQ